jgi:hypothetical protein
MLTPLRPATLLVLLATLGVGVGTSHCGGAASPQVSEPEPDGGMRQDATAPGEAGVPGVPTNHVPTAVTCSTSRPPGVTLDAGPDSGSASESAIAAGMAPCADDAQCTAGQDGRCLQVGQGVILYRCTYDQCATDSDCPAMNVCQCEGNGNTCLPGNCRTDTDCGQGGYCSPSYGATCGSYSGLAGYYCHTANDDCTNDSQCSPGGVGSYCYYSPQAGKWTCSSGGVCAG